MPTDQDRILPSRAQLMPFYFYQQSLTPGMINVAMRAQESWVWRYVFPYAAEVESLSWVLSGGPLVAGSIKVEPIVAGQGNARMLLVLPSEEVTYRVPRGSVTLRPGDTFGINLSTSADFEATTPAQAHLALCVYTMVYVDEENS